MNGKKRSNVRDWTPLLPHPTSSVSPQGMLACAPHHSLPAPPSHLPPLPSRCNFPLSPITLPLRGASRHPNLAQDITSHSPHCPPTPRSFHVNISPLDVNLSPAPCKTPHQPLHKPHSPQPPTRPTLIYPVLTLALPGRSRLTPQVPCLRGRWPNPYPLLLNPHPPLILQNFVYPSKSRGLTYQFLCLSFCYKTHATLSILLLNSMIG